MPLNIPFFRSGSNLIGNKKDALERSASVTEHDRVKASTYAKEVSEIKEKMEKMDDLQRKYRINNEEIARREAEIAKLEEESGHVRKKMEAVVMKESSPAHTTLVKEGDTQKSLQSHKENHPDASLGVINSYSKKIDHIDALKKIQSSEIEALRIQNLAIDKHISNSRLS